MMEGIVSWFKKHRHAFIVAFIGFLVSLGLFYALQIQEERYLLSIAQLGIETIDTHIQAELNFNAHILKHVASQAEKTGDDSAQTLALTTDLLATYPQILSLAHLTSYNNINWMRAKSRARDDKPLLEQFLHTNAQAVRNRSTIWVSSPLRLSDHKMAFFMVLPYKSPSAPKDRPPHYFISLLDCSYLLHRNAQLPGMVFKVSLNHLPVAASEPNSGDDRRLFEVSESLFGGLWQIKAQEVTINLGLIHLISKEAPLSWITFILGILISLLLARSTALSDLLKEHTLGLEKSVFLKANTITWVKVLVSVWFAGRYYASPVLT